MSSTGRQANELPAISIAFVFDSMEMFCRLFSLNVPVIWNNKVIPGPEAH